MWLAEYQVSLRSRFPGRIDCLFKLPIVFGFMAGGRAELILSWRDMRYVEGGAGGIGQS